MTVTVRLFAMLRDAAGTDQCDLEVPEGSDGLAVRRYLMSRCGKLSDYLDYCRVAINREYSSWCTPLRHGDEVSLIPPVSGG